MSRLFPAVPMLRAVLALTLPIAGCSDDDGGPVESPMVMEKAPSKSGDQQFGTAGEALISELRVIVTRDGAAVPNVAVNWATGDGGSLAPTSSNTDENGIATSSWTLGPTAGEQNATASVSEAEGSPVIFSATANPPEQSAGATVQVLSEGGNRFEPSALTIEAGQTVTWVWPEGSVGHNVAPDGTVPPRSGDLADGPETYAFTFTTPGVYSYYCEAHGGPGGVGMAGTVTVVPAAP